MKHLSNKIAKKIGAGALAVALLAGSIYATSGFSQISSAETNPTDKSETEKAIEKKYPELLKSQGGATEDKEESVYVVMSADSKVEKIVVSEHLHNDGTQKTIKDSSILQDIENTSGDEKFTQDGETLVWQADGKDINYTGTTDKELPVDVKVSYYLDGQQMTASEIAGKAGKVEIRFDYTVNRVDNVNGYAISHPYVMASGVMLDNRHFTDVKVSSGEVINDGSNTVALGIAMPGLLGNLGISDAALAIPGSVTISAYTDNFQMDGTYTIALSGMLDGIDMDGAASTVDAKISELTNGLTELSDASNKLVSGSKELAAGTAQVSDGASTLRDKSGELQAGTGALKAGADELQGGTTELKGGVAGIKSGSAELKNGTSKLVTGFAGLQQGVATLKEGTSSLKAGTDNLAANSKALRDGAANLMNGTQLVDQTLLQLSQSGTDGQALAAATAQMQTQLLAQANAALAGQGLPTITLDNYNQILPGVIANLEAAGDTANANALRGIMGSLDYSLAVQSYYSGVDTLYNGTQTQTITTAGGTVVKPGLKDGAAELYGGLDVLAEGTAKYGATKPGAPDLAKGAKDVDDGVQALQDGINKAAPGATALDRGVDKLGVGANQLSLGADKLNQAAGQIKAASGKLDDGATALVGGIKQLADGAKQAADGAKELAEGMNSFDEQGIDKFVNSLSETGLDGTLARLRAVSDASSYDTLYAGKAEGMTGKSKIIYKTEEIKSN